MVTKLDLYGTYYYLRKEIGQWVLDSKKAAGNKCSLTGEKNGLQVHHMHKSFHAIVDEALAETNLTYKASIKHYTEEELKTLRDKCLEIHYRYGLGAVLSKRMHDSFHYNYPGDRYTYEDYKAFKSKYKRKVMNSRRCQAN
jgi:hypothetical protein